MKVTLVRVPVVDHICRGGGLLAKGDDQKRERAGSLVSLISGLRHSTVFELHSSLVRRSVVFFSSKRAWTEKVGMLPQNEQR